MSDATNTDVKDSNVKDASRNNENSDIQQLSVQFLQKQMQDQLVMMNSLLEENRRLREEVKEYKEAGLTIDEKLRRRKLICTEQYGWKTTKFLREHLEDDAWANKCRSVTDLVNKFLTEYYDSEGHIVLKQNWSNEVKSRPHKKAKFILQKEEETGESIDAGINDDKNLPEESRSANKGSER